MDSRELKYTSPTLKSMKTLYMMVNSSGHEHIELNKEEIEKPKNLLGTIESPSVLALSLSQIIIPLLLLLVSRMCLS